VERDFAHALLVEHIQVCCATSNGERALVTYNDSRFPFLLGPRDILNAPYDQRRRATGLFKFLHLCYARQILTGPVKRVCGEYAAVPFIPVQAVREWLVGFRRHTTLPHVAIILESPRMVVDVNDN